MTARMINRIAIVGGGCVGWTLAAVLARGLRQQPITIRVVETSQAESCEAAESSQQSIVPLGNILGVRESHLMASTCAGFKLGTRYLSGSDRGFVVPFGEVGKRSPFGDFAQYLIRAWSAHGEQTPYDAFSLAAVAARHNRFAKPVQDPASILSTLAYGLNLDTKGYASFMKSLASELGVDSVGADVREVVLDSDNGFINSAILSKGQQVEADLWVDATGCRGRLIDQALEVGFQSWESWLPCNRLLTWKTAVDQTPAPMDTLVPDATGWLHQVPLQGGLASSRLYHGDYVTEEELADQLEAGAELLTINPGCRQAPWTKNCVAVGSAAGSPAPLAVSHLQLAQAAAIRLLDLLPFGGPMAANAGLYNRITLGELERVRDFHIAHYHLADMSGSVFWQQTKPGDLPDSLVHSLELFRYRGRVAFYEHEVIKRQTWTAFLLGMGIRPRHYDPVLDVEPLDQCIKLNKHILAAIAQTVARLPTHAEILARVNSEIASPRSG